MSDAERRGVKAHEEALRRIQRVREALEAKCDRLAAENTELRKDVVEARQWAERWQQLAHELGADIQQAAAALREGSGDE